MNTECVGKYARVDLPGLTVVDIALHHVAVMLTGFHTEKEATYAVIRNG